MPVTRQSSADPLSTIRIGCSGWHYAGWSGRFYDAALPKREWLSAYASVFDTVELNNSFYRLPEAEQFARWREAVSKGFLFAVKASRYLTHLKRLRDPDEPLERLLSRAVTLGPALGPILYQLPPRWVPEPERLRAFLERLPRRHERRLLTHVIEFRDPDAYTPEVLEALRAHDVALCVHDMPGSACPRVVTSDVVYVRLHGYGRRYGGSYPDEQLADWAEWLTAQVEGGCKAYVYFNNDIDGHAVVDAQRLRTRLATP